ncbi:MAG: right-handed parallel beta-helix repeat-containing protein, partial [Pirellulaceae bacterium]
QDFNDEDDAFPTSAYQGTSVGDGVSISADGIDWFVIYTAPTDAAWQPVTIDLKAAADAAGIALGSQFMIKFQQTDDADDVTEGRGFDNIQIHAEVLDLTHWADLTDVVLFSDIDLDLVAEVRTLTFPAESPLDSFRLEAARDPALGTRAPFEIADNGAFYGGNEGKNPVLEVQYVGYGDGREYTLTASHTDRGNNLTTDFDGDIDEIAIPGDFRSNFNRGGFGPGGEVTGAAFLNGTLYFVSGPEFDFNDGGFFGGSTGGGLYKWTFGTAFTPGFSSFVANIFDTSEIDLEGVDPLVDDEPSASDLIPFGGLTEAPALVENGLYANLLTGIGVDGRLVAFNPDPDAFNIIVPGQLEPIFFHNNSVVKSGGNGLINGIGYSELESNVIGPATAAADAFQACVDIVACDGMGVDTAPDGSRLGDGNEGGFGVGGFNFAGGAHGSSITEPFSLADYSAEDQPFLYFSYLINIDTISDAFRVFASADGENWGMLATTDPTEIGFGEIDGTWHEVQQLFNSPATHWRQARIPLHNYAGKSDIRLRIDFSTHNEMNVGDPLTTGDELRAIPGAKLRDGQSFELNAWIQEDNFQDLPTDVPEHMANRFEVDLGHTLVLPSGGRIQDGYTITVDNNLATGPDTIVLEFDDDDLDGIRSNNYGDGVADGRILVPYDATLTPHEVALVTQIAIETALDRFIPREFTFLGTDDRGRIANTNDTLATAVETGMMFGSAIFTGDGFIGDNTRLTPDVRFPLKASADDILKDVDFYKFYAAERSQITINLSSTEIVNLNLFDADGIPVPLSIPDGTFPAFGNEATDPSMSAVLPHHNGPPEPRVFQSDPGFITSEGFYYVGISGEGNAAFDPFQMGTGVAGTSATDYTVTISVSNPDAPPINETDTNLGEITTVVENFETVNLDGSWTTSSTDPLFGRIRVTDSQSAADGNFALFMDYVGLLPTDNNNEAILSVDVTDLNAPLLRFSHTMSDDELTLLPTTYTGSVDGDGVSISMDGVNWIRVYDGASSDATWQQETIDLAAVALANGISLDGTLEIKFQQFDNWTVPLDGRGYDSISISEAGVPTAPVHGDGRIAIDHEYTFINTFLNENRLNVPYAEAISSSFLTGRQIEGEPGVFAGKPADTTVFPPVPAIPPNRPLVVHAGLSVDQVAEVISHRLADIYNGGDDRLVKRDDHIVKLIGHQVTENDLGPQGNHPESLGLTRFGVTGQQFDFQILPGDDLFDRTGLLYAETGTWENSGPFVGGQNNTGSAVINDIIIGFAERGEMVVNAANGTLNSGGWITNPQLRTDQVFDGAYQLEIRRAADYGLSVFPVVNDEFPYPFTQQFVAYRAFDTNERLDHVVTLVIPSASDVNDGQMFTLSDGVDQLTFEYTDIDLNNGVEAGNVAIPYLDFESDNLLAERIRDAINSPQVQDVLAITASLSDGDVVTTDSGSNLIDLFGNVIGRLPDNDIVESYDPFDFGDIEVTLHGVDQMTVTKDGKTSEYRVEYGFTGDANLDRDQGQIVLDSNIIAHTSDFGIASNPAQRIGGNPSTAVRNFSELNDDRLVPGLMIVNNLLYDNANGGISLTGETFAAALGPVPFVRVVNNTFVGQGQVAANTGILVGENMSPTLLNNIVSNYQTGISIDAASASTVITGMLYKDNGTNVAGAGLGDFAIDLDSP